MPNGPAEHTARSRQPDLTHGFGGTRHIDDTRRGLACDVRQEWTGPPDSAASHRRDVDRRTGTVALSIECLASPDC